MAGRNRTSGEQLPFPELSTNGCKMNENEPTETSVDNWASTPGNPEGTAEFTLSCESRGVTLTTRFPLPLSDSLEAERNLIVVTCVGGLIGDLKDLAG